MAHQHVHNEKWTKKNGRCVDFTNFNKVYLKGQHFTL